MIKLTEKIGYGFGDMASSMFWKLFGAYLMIFYTDVFGLPAAAVGTMFLITRIWDSVFDPIVGTRSLTRLSALRRIVRKHAGENFALICFGWRSRSPLSECSLS